MYEPESVQESSQNILCDFEIQRDLQIPTKVGLMKMKKKIILCILPFR